MWSLLPTREHLESFLFFQRLMICSNPLRLFWFLFGCRRALCPKVTAVGLQTKPWCGISWTILFFYEVEKQFCIIFGSILEGRRVISRNISFISKEELPWEVWKLLDSQQAGSKNGISANFLVKHWCSFERNCPCLSWSSSTVRQQFHWSWKIRH